MKSSLNHIYRSIWSEVLNAWVAASELTNAKGKRSGSSVLNTVLTASAINANNSTNHKLGIKLVALAVAYSFTLNAAQANPVGAQVASGTAAISQIGNTLTVTNSPSAIINWQGFSINAGETTRFVQQSASSAVLNRVVGADPSQLLGTLTSNGKVFLINPNGILVGQGARIDVAGLVASTLNLSNEDFLAGKLNFGLTPGAGSIQNFGTITTPEGGTVYLVASQVDNQGIITTPKGETILAAGNTVQLLDTGTPGVTVQVTGADNSATNVGQVLADSGRIGMVGALVKNSGTLGANSLVSQGGRVFLKASKDVYIEKNARIEASGTQGGSIEVLGNRVAVTDNASLDASGQNGGGTVLAGGDYQGRNPDVQNAAITYFGTNASIKADALNYGNGGKVILWADDTTRAYGSISVRGGVNGGNGGFVETSGHRYLDVTRAPDMAAPQGKAGSWLLDPGDITISSSAGSNISGAPVFTPAASGSSFLSDAVLRAALVAGGTVTVDTTGGGAGFGNILVDNTANLANIGVGAGAILNLKAHNDITVNSSITATGLPLAMNLTADQDNNNLGAVFINAPLDSNGGNINVSSFGNIKLNAGTGNNITAGAGTVNLTSTGGFIEGDVMGVPLDVSAASVGLNAANGISASGGAQFYVNAGSISFNNSGPGTVRIYNERAGASSFTGSSLGGPVILESSDSANPTSIGNISAGGNIVFRMNNINITSSVSAGANTVYLAPFTFNSPVSINGAAQFDLTGAEISNISAGKIVVGYDTFGNYASAASIGTMSAVNITNAANVGVVAPTIAIGAANFTNTNGSLALQTDSLAFGAGIINVGATGNVMISGKSKTQIDLGGVDAANVLGLSAAGVGAITAGKLLVGDTFTTSMQVSSAISFPNVTTLSLTSGTGGISGAGSLQTVTNLAIRSVGSVDLGTSYSAVSNLAASVGNFTTPNNPNFKFKNTPVLNIGAGVDGLSGISISLSGTYNSASPDGVIALISNNGLTQSAGALLAGKAVYAEGSSVILTEANPTGVISGKATGASAGKLFNYASSNGIAVTTVNGFSGIQAINVTDPIGILLTAGSAGISQDATAPISTGTGLMLSTTGPVNFGAAPNNVAALGTAASAGQFAFNNNSALTLGVTGNGISTANQPVNITANGLLTLKDGVSAGTGSVALEAPDIQIGATGVAGTTISGGFIKLRTGAAGTISTAGTSASTLTSSSGIGLEADNINFAVAPTLNATQEVGFKTYTDNRSITIGSACNGADPSCLKLDGAFLSSANVNAPDLVIGNEVVADTNTAGNIHVDAAINHAGRVALITGGTIDQTAAITTTGLGIIAGGAVALNAGNAITNLAGKTTGGSFSLTNGQSLNIVTETGGLGPNTVTLSGITASGGVTLQTTGATSDIVLNNAVTSGASGNAVVLAAGRNFVNTAGAAAISAPNGRWLVYSTNPAGNTFGGLDSTNLPLWGKTYTSYAPASVTETGNRYLFSFQPNLTATVNGGNITKSYGADLTGTPPTATITGLVNAATFGNVFTQEAYTGSGAATSTGFAANAHVQGGAPYTVTVAGNLTAPTGYGATTYNDVSLTVTPAVLTATLVNAGVTKAYDGTTNAPAGFVPAYSFTGLIAGDTAATLANASAVYNNAHVAAATTLTVSGLAIGGVTGANASVTGDYTLNGVTSRNVAASITSRLLTASLTNAGVTKTYDGMTSAPAGFTPTYSIMGFAAGDSAAALTSTGAAYNSAHVVGATAVTVSGLGIASITGGNSSVAGDYALSAGSLNVAASITPLALTSTAAIGGTLTKTYDATTAATGATLSGSVSGGIAGDTLTLNTTPVSLAYNGSQVTAANTIIATGTAGFTISGSSAGSLSSDYSFSAPVIANAAASITPASLLVTANADNKIYDGIAYWGGNGVVYSGLVGGETSAALGGVLTYGGSSQGAIDVGSYLITPGGLTSSNYTIGFVDGALAVVPPITTATTAAVQTVAMTTTTSTTSATTTTTSDPLAAPALDANALLSTAPTASTSGSATGTFDSSGGGIGGAAGSFGGGESTPPAAAPEGSAQNGGKGTEGAAKKDDKANKDEKAKKDDKDKKDDTAKKDEGNTKDDNSNKDKKNAKPEKC